MTPPEVIEELVSGLEACVIVLDDAIERAEDTIAGYEYHYATTSIQDDEIIALAAWLERAKQARTEANVLL